MKLIILLTRDLDGLFEKYHLEGNACLLPEQRKICPEIITYCAELFQKAEKSDKDTIVITGNQTVVSILSHKMLEANRDYKNILLWENKELVPISQYSKEDWLSCFDLGDLYMRGELGKPKTGDHHENR